MYDAQINVVISNEPLYDKINQLKAEIITLNQTIASLNEQIASKDIQINELTSQVSNLTTQVESLTSQVASLTTENAELRAVVEPLREQVATLTEQVSTLTAQVSTLTDENAQLTSQISELQASVQSLNEQVTNLNTQISNMNTAINTINGETVQNPIEYLADTKSQILTALQSKGSSATSSTTFRNYANEIINIPSYPPEETTLLLHLDSNNGLSDSSSYHRPILTYGTGTPTIVTTESKFGNGSLYLDGTCGLYINQTDFYPFQTPEWTFECFFKPIGWVTTSTYAFFGNRYIYNSGTSYSFDCYQRFIYWPQYTVFNFTHENITSPTSTSMKSYEFTASMPTEEWHHLAVVRNSLDANYFEQYYLDGIALPVNTYNAPYMYNSLRNISIFHNLPSVMSLMCFNAQTEFNRFTPCYVNEIRFSSVCRYTSSFTPPTEPFSV